MFVIHANLDAEARWAGVPLPGRVMAYLRTLAPMLVALAPTDDVEIVGPGEDTALADLRWADPDAKAANDRRLARQVFPMVGAKEIADVSELDDMRGRWVAKARWTTAGRDRAHGDGPPHGEQRVFVTRLLARFGTLIVEPWLERVADVGVCAWLGEPPQHLRGHHRVAGDLHVWRPHRIITDARGGFHGIAADPPAVDLDAIVGTAARALAALAYRGPFAVDALVHAGGLHVCEINARYTFGFVARGGALTVRA
jgi:hypothetical protein